MSLYKYFTEIWFLLSFLSFSHSNQIIFSFFFLNAYKNFQEIKDMRDTQEWFSLESVRVFRQFPKCSYVH